MPASAKAAGIRVGKHSMPITIISDGKLMAENLQAAKKDTGWVRRVLEEKQAALQETWLLTVDGSDRIVFLRKEEA